MEFLIRKGHITAAQRMVEGGFISWLAAMIRKGKPKKQTQHQENVVSLKENGFRGEEMLFCRI